MSVSSSSRDGADRVVAGLRVAWPVGQEDSIRTQRENLGGRHRCRHHRHAAAVVGEHAQDVALDAVVVGDDVQPLLRADDRPRFIQPDAAVVPLVRLLGRDDLGEVHALEAGKAPRQMHGRRFVDLVAGDDATGLRAALAQHARQASRVDAGNGDDAAPLEEFLQRIGRAPVARHLRQIAHHEAGGIDLAGFHVFRRRADVADVRIGESDDLAGIGRVGENFLITGHRGVEHHFSGRVAIGTDGLAAEERAVRQRQHCRSRHVIASPSIDTNPQRAVPPLSAAGVFYTHMHKAGGVLLERPPALCGLTRNHGLRSEFYGLSPSEVHANSGLDAPNSQLSIVVHV